MLLSFLDVTACEKLWEVSSVIYSCSQPELHIHLVTYSSLLHHPVFSDCSAVLQLNSFALPRYLLSAKVPNSIYPPAWLTGSSIRSIPTSANPGPAQTRPVPTDPLLLQLSTFCTVANVLFPPSPTSHSCCQPILSRPSNNPSTSVIAPLSTINNFHHFQPHPFNFC